MMICPVCNFETSFEHDHKPDNSGLDDGPEMSTQRKKAAPKPPEVMADIRSRAWRRAAQSMEFMGMVDELPGYDAWKLATPPEYEITPEQERALEQERWEQQERLREAVADAMHNERGNLYLADIRRIVIEELNKLARRPGEPEWQTRTAVPLKFDEQACALREADVVLAFCFNRLHPSARARDGELCASIGKVRAMIERAA